jgi:hypothetical protein
MRRARARPGNLLPGSLRLLPSSLHVDIHETIRRLLNLSMHITTIDDIPDDLLVEVARWVQMGGTSYQKDNQRRSSLLTLQRMASVSRRIRTSIVYTPSLWTYVDLRMMPEFVEICLDRAATCPLNVLLSWTDMSDETTTHLIRCLHTTNHLSIVNDDLGNPPTHETRKRVQAANAPLLRTLTESSWTGQTEYGVSYQLLNHGTLCNLTHIHMDHIFLDDVTWATVSVRHLQWSSGSCLPRDIHRILSSSPHLEHLELNKAMFYVTDDDNFPSSRIDLPRLRTMCIEDTIENIGILLTLLPDPISSLTIICQRPYHDTTKASRASVWSSIVSRLRTFWQAAGATTSFPCGRLRYDSNISHGSSIQFKGSAPPNRSFSFFSSGYMEEGESMLHEISSVHVTLTLVVSNIFPKVPATPLARLEEIEVEDEGLTSMSLGRRRALLPAVENWITQQVDGAKALRLITFRSRHSDLREVFDRLAAAKNGPQMVWEAVECSS